ncbi:class I SAM-dependent methyltransferase [Dyadobacter sp. 3J3]|uniref:class I SAM-dependent methyltransferase n=1 Tax=Dyadobacter sp. 3J3 TaxID=2606600 RepID=UPI00135BFF80|nr:class I SAM-dependent methyltransferase [Dyadobacter sp. 3J3]
MDAEQTIKKTFKKNYIPIYKPAKLIKPKNLPDVISAWKGLELIIEDILDGFDLERISCIEFGVGFGFSIASFSNYFERVTGIDTFDSKSLSGEKVDHFEETKAILAEHRNIRLFKSDYRDWIKKDKSRYNLAHIDIVHQYEETYECGLWAARHSDCTVFHDTESFPEVRQAAIDIAIETGQSLYNYPLLNGLGILVDKDAIQKRHSQE